jgi:hypothetical protein
MRSHGALMAGFVPGRVDAPLHVFMAQASVHSEQTPTDWLLHTRHARRSTQRTLPGDHENVILLAPNIEEIVRTLTQAAEAGAGRNYSDASDDKWSDANRH